MDVRAQKIELLQLLQEQERRNARRQFFRLYPDDDILNPVTGEILIHARHKYAKHLEHFRAGAQYRARCAMAANRVGKTFGMGGYELAAHLTGWYPHWWEGKRFDGPIDAWAAGKTNETTRDIVQRTLLGPIVRQSGKRDVAGTGVIPGDSIIPGGITWKAGNVPDLVDTVTIKHRSGGTSTLGLKSYEQGRDGFEGTAKHFVWFDEEPPLDVYGEALIRTATTNGCIVLTFTPLIGRSDVVKQFILGEHEAA